MKLLIKNDKIILMRNLKMKGNIQKLSLSVVFCISAAFTLADEAFNNLQALEFKNIDQEQPQSTAITPDAIIIDSNHLVNFKKISGLFINKKIVRILLCVYLIQEEFEKVNTSTELCSVLVVDRATSADGSYIRSSSLLSRTCPSALT